ncbi:MAG: GGDEF domain-containing protein [Cytophagales bacterium]|nr:GGDEF domain-containing protein [Rhizobacter sp.]
MQYPIVHWMGSAVLGTDKRQRVRITQILLTALLDLILTAIAVYGVWAGLLPGLHAALWSVLTLTGVFGFYVAVRSGFNLRFTEDPALTLPQGVFSVFSTVAAYVMTGPVRGASLLALAVTLIVGMFALKPRQVWGLSVFAVALLGATMWWCHDRWPARFPLHEEAMHFMLVAVVLPAIAVLAGQLSKMRHKLVQHRVDLEKALEQNRQLAIHDELTGLYNRRHALELMQQEAQRAERNGRPLCVALIDIDHFKRVNDEHGHAQGDEVLRTFAEGAAAALRETDTLGRWGGEEFIVMLPETPAEAAVGVLARVHMQLSSVRFNAIDPALRVTFSAGIAICQPGEKLAVAIERADQAMYAAKQGGRDRSVVSPVPSSTPPPAPARVIAPKREGVPSSSP